MTAGDEQRKLAKLYKAERGFGGDNYYYRLTPPYEGGSIACVLVGWGLLCPAVTSVWIKTKEDAEDALTKYYFEKEDRTHTPPEVALSTLGYAVVGKVHWKEESQGAALRHYDACSGDSESSTAARA